MKKSLLASLMVILLLVMGGIYLGYWSSKSDNKVIAIVTTLSHSALTSVRQGFIDELKSGFYTDVVIMDYNAEGSVQQANMIARQIAQHKNIVGVFAIGTLAAQKIAKVERHRPIVLAAVADPQIVIHGHQAENICGLTDAIDADYQIDSNLKLLPNIKSISLLYSPHEANSSSMVKKLSLSAKKRDLAVAEVGVYEPQQIMTASIDACQKSDAVLIPLDNQLVASIPAVIKATKAMSCPIVASNEEPVHHGATIAFGVDYKKIGEGSARLMGQIINNDRAPSEIGFIDPPSIALYINDRVVKEKKVTIGEHAQLEVIHIAGEN
jgi:putative ABC transport system substrate-binding protein